MALFNFRLKPYMDGTPEWIKKVSAVFGYLDYEDQIKDKGISLADKEVFIPAHGENGDLFGAQFYGNMRRYVNYEEPTKPQKLMIYRQMADYPEIKYALNMICDDMLNYDEDDGNVGKLSIVNPNILSNINKRDNLMKEWTYIFNDLLNFKDTGRDAIFSFLVSGELMYEKVINPDRKQDGLKRIKRLRPENIYPMWKEDFDGIEAFVVKDVYQRTAASGMVKTIPRSQLAYVNWDHFSQNSDTGDIYVLSYLEPVKKVWRQLQLLEEALVIYRIVRAPERRIFNIATGNMPKGQAEQYIQKIMRTYRQKKIYNSSTGEIDGQQNIMAMLEDYFFAAPADGNKSSIDTLPGGENLGEISDINYFLEKLYRALEIPVNRRIETWSGKPEFNSGSIGDVSWQEVKFSKMVQRVRTKVISIIFELYKSHLKLKGLWEQYNLKDSDFKIDFHKNNFFEEMKKAQVEETRLNNWGTASAYVGTVFSKEWLTKKLLKVTNEEWEENKRMIEKEKLEGDSEVEGGGGGGL